METVVFDMDGVLLDTERLCLDSWLAVAQAQGLKGMEEVFLRCIGLNGNDTVRVVKEAYGEDFNYDGFRVQASAWFHDYIDKKGMPVKPGAVAILKWMKEQGWRVGLASSTREARVRSQLEQVGLLDYFSVVVTGDMVEHSKPLPDIYLIACRELGVKPEEAYAIEDSPNGIRSAHAAGMKPIMVPDMIAPQEEMERLSFRIMKDLREVLEYFRKETRPPGRNC